MGQERFKSYSSADVALKLPPADSIVRTLIPDYALPLFDAVEQHMRTFDNQLFEVDLSYTLEFGLSAQQMTDLVKMMFLYPGQYLSYAPVYAPLAAPWARFIDMPSRFGVWKIALSYTCTPSEGLSDRALISQKVEEIAASAPDGKSEFAKVTFFFDWLVENVEMGEEPTDIQEANAMASLRNAKGALIDGKATCQGLSQAMKALCDAAGIYCAVLPCSCQLSAAQLAMCRDQQPEQTGILPRYRSKEPVYELAGIAEDFGTAHALCFIVADGRPFYCDATLSLSLAQQFGKKGSPWRVGLAMTPSLLSCFGFKPKLAEYLVPELVENDYSDSMRYGIYYGKFDDAAMADYAVGRFSMGAPALFAFDDADAGRRFYTYACAPAFQEGVCNRSGVSGSWVLYNNPDKSTCIIVPAMSN